MQLRGRYLQKNPPKTVCWGKFLALRPFYVKLAPSRDNKVYIVKNIYMHDELFKSELIV